MHVKKCIKQVRTIISLCQGPERRATEVVNRDFSSHWKRLSHSQLRQLSAEVNSIID